MSVRNAISIVMITMHNVVKHCYYSLAALVITLGFSENRGKVAAKYVKVQQAALNSNSRHAKCLPKIV